VQGEQLQGKAVTFTRPDPERAVDAANPRANMLATEVSALALAQMQVRWRDGQKLCGS
jgi:hypothetical protein